MSISLVACTFNNLPYLKLMIASVRRYSSQPHEIIVSVDGSTDGTVEWLLDEVQKERVHTLKFCYHKNRGIAYTLNEGIRQARNSYIATISDDMVVSPGWDKDFDRFLNRYSFFIPFPIHSEERHGGGRKNKDGSWVFPWVEEPWTQNFETFDWAAWEAVVKRFAAPETVTGRRFFWGEMLAHRWLWKAMGGFDEHNDKEFGFRAEQKIQRITKRLLIPITRIKSYMLFHFGQKTKWRFENWKGAESQENIKVFTGNHPKGVY